MTHDPTHDPNHDDAAHHPTPEDDQWFEHAPTEEKPQPEHGKINAKALMGWLGALTVLLVITCVVLIWFFEQEKQRALQMRHEIDVGGSWRAQYTQVNAELSGYAWVDPENNIVSVPIDLAMQKIVRQYQEKQGR
ncbi:MAG: hypothetical protein EA379_01450 [Phycisphaerales bacterium]|nr:MAG: hypothetical protein EA379_01450 [Phycisphaerales bacterium]